MARRSWAGTPCTSGSHRCASSRETSGSRRSGSSGPPFTSGSSADGTLTFQDLLSAEKAPGEAPATEPPAKEEGGLGVWIGRLSVEEARVAFRDATRRPAFDTALGPLTFKLDSFRTKGGGDSPYSFSGTTEAGETLRWTGTVRTQPIHSTGTLAFERIPLPRYAAYIQDQLPADLRDGLLDFETQYALEWGAARRVVKLTDGKVTVDRLAMGPRGVADAPIALSRIEVTGIDVDALASDAKVGARRAPRRRAAGAARGRRNPRARADGSAALEGPLDVGGRRARDLRPRRELGRPRRAATGGASAHRRAAASRGPAIRGRRRVAPRALARLERTWPARREGLGPAPRGKGTLELDAADLDLVPLEPYLAPDVIARLTGGRAGAKAKIGFDASGATPRWTFAGDVRLDALSVAEKGNEDLLRWRALEISGIDAASTPPRASVRLVRLVEPRAKVYVWEDGTTSIARAVRATPAAPGPAAKGRPAAAGPEWRTAIGAVQIVRGRAAVVDRSVTPPALVNVTGAEAKVTRLSSDPRVRSKVDVRLEVEGASPIRVTGTLNPLQKEAFTELTVASQGVDLSPLGPYSGKFLGYGIQKGKLDLDLRYKVENRSLAATNVVTVNQFTLGEKTDSPDATKIPVRLALALLQDKNGVILLDVPIEGNLDDPEFRLGRVIWRTVLNVLVKVATSPFSALAALAGSGDADLSHGGVRARHRRPSPRGAGAVRAAREVARAAARARARARGRVGRGAGRARAPARRARATAPTREGRDAAPAAVGRRRRDARAGRARHGSSAPPTSPPSRRRPRRRARAATPCLRRPRRRRWRTGSRPRRRSPRRRTARSPRSGRSARARRCSRRASTRPGSSSPRAAPAPRASRARACTSP